MADTPMWRRYLRLIGPDVEADVDEELRFHLAMREEELVARGVPLDQAHKEARARLGDINEIRRRCREIGIRAQRTRRRKEGMTMVLHDLRRAVRVLHRSPGFTLVAVLTLALGIGANTAIFSVVNTVLLRPLPVEGLDRLVVIRGDLPSLDLRDTDLGPPVVLDLAAMDDVFQSFTGFSEGDRTLTGFGEPTRLSAAQTLGDFAGVFGVRPHLGRFYEPDAATGGRREVAVVGYGLWQQLSGGDPGFVGRTIRLNGDPYEVVGVMPPDFRYPRQVQVWTPFDYSERWTRPESRGRLMMTAVGRLRPGVTEALLSERLTAEAGRWNDLYHPGEDFREEVRSVPFLERLAGPLRPILLVLMGAVGFVLLIASANVASLQLVRTDGRSREIAVRAALGAGRWHNVRQLLAESLLLAGLGGGLGLGLGALALQLLDRWEPARQMNLAEIRLDGAVLVFTAVAALTTAVAFGLAPALRAARVDPQAALRESGRAASAGKGRNRLLRAIVVVQVMLALVLLLGSGLMIRTLSRLLATDPGFAPGELVTGRVSVAGSASDSPERRPLFFDRLLEGVRAQPGVQDAALAVSLPFAGSNDSSPFDIIGRDPRPGEPERHAEANAVSSGYFRTMGIPLLRGRDFDASERFGSPLVAVIDQTFAEQFFPGENPVGRQILGYTGDPATIVGVAGRVDHDEIGDALKAVAYYPLAQQPWRGTRFVVVRSDQPIGSVTAALRRAVAELDPAVPLFDVQSMDRRVERSLGPRRLAMLSLGAFAALSLLLAALGVYGVMRFTTGQRSREIGIRMAMGAQPRDVVRMVVRQGMGSTLLGLALGVAAALWLGRLMTGLLFGISPHDPVSLLGAVTLLAGVSLLATWVPARRATRVNPAAVLRTE